MEQKTKIYLAAPDSTLNRELRMQLEDGGYQIQEALDWTLISEEVGLFGADLVVMTEQLSDSVQQIKRDPRTADRPVLLVLEEATDQSIRRGLDQGADDVICLPILGADLINRVRLLRRAALEALEMPELAYSVADDLAPIALDEDEDAPPSGARLARQYGDGLLHGMDGAYENDLGVLIEVSEAMASSLPTVDALYVLTRRISEIIPVHRCNVLLVGVKPDEAFVVASHEDANLRKQQVDLRRYPEVRRCLESGDIVLIEDVRKDPEMEEVVDFITSVDLRSALVFPLFVHEVVVGTLSLTTRREIHGFTRRELLFTRVMGNMAAGLLSTSELLGELRRDAAAEKPPMEEFDEVVLDLEDQIEGLIEELERK